MGSWLHHGHAADTMQLVRQALHIQCGHNSPLKSLNMAGTNLALEEDGDAKPAAGRMQLLVQAITDRESTRRQCMQCRRAGMRQGRTWRLKKMVMRNHRRPHQAFLLARSRALHTHTAVMTGPQSGRHAYVDPRTGRYTSYMTKTRSMRIYKA